MSGRVARTRRAKERKVDDRKKTRVHRGATIMPAKGRIEWPYVALLIGIVLMIAAPTHLLSAWSPL